jgi:hypothetical protein
LAWAPSRSAAAQHNALAPAGEARRWRDTAADAVLLPETPAAQDEVAARLLGDAVEKMTGVRLPVVRAPAVPPDRFVSLGATRAVVGHDALPRADHGLRRRGRLRGHGREGARSGMACAATAAVSY